MAKKGNKKKLDEPPRIVNRKARHDYHIDSVVECGIVLQGTEVKQLRLGQAQMSDAYARIDRGELYLYGIHIDPYGHASDYHNHAAKRVRKLLAHKREIRRLEDATRERGVTLVPTVLYFKDGRAKVELGVARGKKTHDKREDLKRKVAEREISRTMSKQLRGGL